MTNRQSIVNGIVADEGVDVFQQDVVVLLMSVAMLKEQLKEFLAKQSAVHWFGRTEQRPRLGNLGEND